MAECKPTRPVPRGCAGGFFTGRYKVVPEDFLVEELPAYEPSGAGEHLWLWLEKRRLSTFDLCAELGRLLRVDPRQVGIAGLKDAQSVSRQWVSVQGLDEAAVAGLQHDRFKVLRVARHGNKLRLGHLRGNRFVVTLRGTAAGDLEVARRNLVELEQVGVPNYFGEQRFGKRGANLEKGLRILRGGARALARTMPRRVFGLVVSAVQSEVFNRVVIERIATLGTLLRGDLAFLHRNGACFPVDDPTREQPRATAFELSPSGPMPGPKMPQPQGEPLAIETRVLAAMGLEPGQFTGLPFGVASGERRPLRVPVTDTAVEAVAAGLELRFSLPRGSYATAVLRELLAETIWFADEGN